MKIEIQLNSNRIVNCDNTIIGKTLENEATTLCFILTEELLDKDFYIEFEKADGTKVSTPKLDIQLDESEIIKTKGIVDYPIPNSLLDIKGELKAEVVLRKLGVVWKSYTLKFNVLNSINASEEVANEYPDFITDAQKVIDEFQDKINKADIIVTNGSGDKYLSDDGTYREVEGGTGGTSDYNKLNNKPSINDVELSDNKTLEELGIQPKGDYLKEETDPTIPSYIKDIKEEDITKWNNKSEFSGNYNDLQDKPELFSGDYNDLENKPELFSGDYNDLTNTPNIPEVPTNISAFTNDAGYITEIPSEYINETELEETLEEKDYANKEYVNEIVGNIEALLGEI